MIRTFRCVLFLCCLSFATSAFAFPEFLENFRRDPMRRSDVDGCATCHMSPQGGDARNPFGQAFDAAGRRFTPLLRAQFPDRFTYPTSRPAGNLVFHFSDPANKQLVVESGATRTLVDVEAKSVNGAPAAGAAPQEAAAAPAGAQPAAQSDVRVDPYAREGAFFGMQIVNLPNGKPIKAGGVDFTVQHRFAQDIENAGLGGLFGFDSSGRIAFGGRVGLTDRWSAGIARTNNLLRKTIEFSSSFNIARQSASFPITLAVRGGVQGRNNFHEDYSPYIQTIATTTIKDRVSFSLVPIFAFNTRDEDSFAPPELLFGAQHNDTIALGIGTGIRFLPSVSLVGEYIPRLWGFRGEFTDRPGVSMGLQKSTFRHTFELVVSRQDGLTTSDYAVQGTGLFKIGFNIYRRIR